MVIKKKKVISKSKKSSKSKSEKSSFASLKEKLTKELKAGFKKKNLEPSEQILSQRKNLLKLTKKSKNLKKSEKGEYLLTGVPGFDDLFEQGIPVGNSMLVAGGAGSGKTIFCLQTLFHHASQGKNCIYMSFEESEEKLKKHMKDFGWNLDTLKKKNLIIRRFSPFDITRSVDALLMKAKGELLIDLEPVILPKNFKPDLIVIDSLTAVASAFAGKEDSYRIYIEQLFRFLEKLKSTSFLITETQQIPIVYSQAGVEEFLADGVIVFYNIKRGNVRENAIEILKLRGAKHQKRIVAMQITDEGLMVYPEQEVFGGIE